MMGAMCLQPPDMYLVCHSRGGAVVNGDYSRFQETKGQQGRVGAVAENILFQFIPLAVEKKKEEEEEGSGKTVNTWITKDDEAERTFLVQWQGRRSIQRKSQLHTFAVQYSRNNLDNFRVYRTPRGTGRRAIVYMWVISKARCAVPGLYSHIRLLVKLERYWRTHDIGQGVG